jgi:poly(glycerol-phosphate) alpha-glucosyltransferase
VTRTALPRGQYFFVTSRLALGSGGQTGMMLLHSRIFAEKAGVAPVLLSFDDQPDYPHIRAGLTATGQLAASTVILNLYEWLRNEPPPLAPDDASSLPSLEGLLATDLAHPDGTVHLTAYRDPADPEGSPVVTDHRRPDGSVYLRRGQDGIRLADRLNRIVRTFGGTGALRRWWVPRLFDPDSKLPVFIITESRFALRSLVPLNKRSRVRLIHVVHNIHVHQPYLPDSEVNPTHEPVLEAIPQLSALVTLTERQRDDICARFDSADNVHVIPNPVDDYVAPDPVSPRRPRRFVMIGRLTPQKRFEDAVSAFARVVAEEPDATLDIYGEGARRIKLQAQIDKAGLGRAVRLRGYDPRARDQLSSATALLLTSRFEGYPLVVLEALQRGCPVIAYDIAYGPREQVGDAGLLIPPGDVGALAAGILRLIRSPELLAQMSAAARPIAEEHSAEQHLHAWQVLLQAVASEDQRDQGDPNDPDDPDDQGDKDDQDEPDEPDAES